MALQTLDPLALSATKLQAGGMDAQEVAYKRKAMEDDLAKTQLAVAAKDRETAQKQKEADQKLALMPTYDTLSQQHTKFAFEWMSKEKETRAAEELAYRQGLGGNPNDPTTPEGLARWNRTVNYGQIAANSKQMESTGAKWLERIAANPKWYKPNAKDEIYKWQTSTEPLLTGEVANMPQELFDLQGAIADVFGEIKPEIQAWASADGTSSGTKQFIPSSSFLKTAEIFATEPNAKYSLEQRFNELTPEKQAQIDADAKRYGTNRNTAMAVDAAKALYDRTVRTAQSEQQNEAGYGKAVDEAGAINFIEKGIGMNDPSNKGRTLKDIGLVDIGTITDFLNNNPQLQRFAVDIPKNAEIFNGYNGMVYETKEADGKRINRYVAGIVREPNTGNTQLITVDGTGGTPKVSKPIPSEKFYTEVMDPLAVNSEELDHKKVGYVFQKNYSPIYKQEGNVKLPTKGGAWDLNEAGEAD